MTRKNKILTFIFSLILFLGNINCVHAAYVKLNETMLDLHEGETYQLTAIISPEGEQTVLTWSSTRPDIATVDQNGKVTAVKAVVGYDAWIYVSTEDGNSHKCSVSVMPKEKEKVTVTCQFVLNGKVVSPSEVKSGYSSPLKVECDKGGRIRYQSLRPYGTSVTIDNSQVTGPFYDTACTKAVNENDTVNKDTTVYFKVVLPMSSNNNNTQTNTNKNEETSNDKNQTTDKNNTSTTDKTQTGNKDTANNTNKNQTTTNKTDKTDTTNKNTVTNKNEQNSNGTNSDVENDKKKNDQDIIPLVIGGGCIGGGAIALILLKKKKGDKNMKKEPMSPGKKILILLLACLLGFGGYFGYTKWHQAQKAKEAANDNSYKEVTQRDETYDGFYTLTKLDENGENTWDGLVMYVVKDKIVSCTKYDYWSPDELKSGYKAKYGKEIKNLNINDYDLFMVLPNNSPMTLGTGFDKGTLLSNHGGRVQGLVSMGDFLCTDKVDFNRVRNNNTDYQYMQSCDLVPGYDEKSQEVWLSKLLNNENSIYHSGYKLINYKYTSDMMDCALNTGDWMVNMNTMFGADFKNNHTED